MKKFFLIFGISVIFIFNLSHLTYAQDNPLKFGIRGGLNLANFNEDIFQSGMYSSSGLTLPVGVDQSMRNTFGFGGFLEYWINPTVAIQFNGMYNMKGVLVDININTTVNVMGINFDVNGNVEDIVALSYLSFPILGKIVFGKEGAIRPYLLAGPEIGFLLSAEEQGEGKMTVTAMGTSQTESIDETIDIKDDLESTEFALNFGGGVVIPMGNTNLFLDARYGLGLTKINKESGAGVNDVKNNIIYINLGILF
jgi:hypothetical protein